MGYYACQVHPQFRGKNSTERYNHAYNSRGECGVRDTVYVSEPSDSGSHNSNNFNNAIQSATQSATQRATANRAEAQSTSGFNTAIQSATQRATANRAEAQSTSGFNTLIKTTTTSAQKSQNDARFYAEIARQNEAERLRLAALNNGGGSGTGTPRIPTRPATFNEAQYRSLYPDVDRAIRSGQFSSAWQHYHLHGKREGRKSNFSGSSNSTLSENALPYDVAKSHGITAGELNGFLKKALVSYNKENGTNLQLDRQGYIRTNGGSGSYMDANQRKDFNSTIALQVMDYRYGNAIDKAVATGDTKALRDLDMFFTGKEAPAIRYSKGWVGKEQKARALGMSMEDYDKKLEAEASAKAVEESKLAAAEATAEQPGDVIEPEGASDAGESSGETQNDQPEVEPSSVENEDESLKPVKGGSLGVGDEQNDEVQQSALATRRAKDEDRLKKILKQREKWGGASAGSGAEALAAPVITPASNSQGFGGIPQGK